MVNTHRTRNFTLTYDENYKEWDTSGGADNFLEFIEKELRPYISEKFPHKSDAYNSLAEAYEVAGKLNNALEMRNRALEVSIKENDENNALKTRKANLLRKSMTNSIRERVASEFTGNNVYLTKFCRPFSSLERIT